MVNINKGQTKRDNHRRPPWLHPVRTRFGKLRSVTSGLSGILEQRLNLGSGLGWRSAASGALSSCGNAAAQLGMRSGNLDPLAGLDRTLTLLHRSMKSEPQRKLSNANEKQKFDDYHAIAA